MKLYKSIIIILLVFFTTQIQAQNETTNSSKKLSLDSGTIENQFKYLTEESSDWRNNKGQHFKVVKIQWVKKLKKNTLDSLKAIQKALNNTKDVVAKQETEILKLKTGLTSVQSNLDQTKIEKDNISVLGIQMSKGGYSALIWSIIFGLLVLALFFIYKFKNSNTITLEAKKALAETEEEFEEHRRIALEREQKVRRQLQDEIIKNKNSN